MNFFFRISQKILFHALVFFLFFTLMFDFKIAFFVTLGCLLVSKLRFFNIKILSFVSFATWLFIPFFWQIERNINFLSSCDFGTILLYRLMILGLISLTAYLLMLFKFKYQELCFLLFSAVLFYIFYSEGSAESKITQLGRYFLGAYKYFILPIAFLIFYQKKSLTNDTWIMKIKKIPLILPAWNIRAVLPIGYAHELDLYDEALDKEKYVNSLKSSSRLIILSLATLVLIGFIKFIIYQQKEMAYFQFKLINYFSAPEYLHIQDVAKGYDDAILINKTPVTKWISLILGFICIYAERIFVLNVSVIIARFMGYDLPSSFNEPWKAKTISQFYGRFLYYYNQVLMILFVYPLRQVLYFIKDKVDRFYLSLVLGITIGGFYFHFFVRDFERIFYDGFWRTLIAYLPTLCYFLSIGLVIVWSQFISHKSLEKYFTIKNHFIKIVMYLFIWSFVYNMYVATFHAHTSLEKYLIYLKGLFDYQ